MRFGGGKKSVDEFAENVDQPKQLMRPFSGKPRKAKKVVKPPKALPITRTKMPSLKRGLGLKGLGGL